MIRKAREIDPAGDYRRVEPADFSGLTEGLFDLVLSAFTFDNIPQGEKARHLRGLAALLAPGGRLVNLVSRPEIYTHEWASFSTRDFPLNRDAKSGDLVKIVMTDVTDRRPVEDVVCTQAAYVAAVSRVGTRRDRGVRAARARGRALRVGQRDAGRPLAHRRPEAGLRRLLGPTVDQSSVRAADAALTSNVWRTGADGAGLARPSAPPAPARRPARAAARARSICGRVARRDGEVGAIVDQLALRQRSGLDQQLQPPLPAFADRLELQLQTSGHGIVSERVPRSRSPPGTARRCGPTWPAGRRRPPSRPCPGAAGRPSSSGCAPARGALPAHAHADLALARPPLRRAGSRPGSRPSTPPARGPPPRSRRSGRRPALPSRSRCAPSRLSLRRGARP